MPLTSSDLVVEDGTGLATANTYISIADTDAYHLIRGNELWSDADENDKVVALVRATQYVDERWVYQSVRFVATQALIFPRTTLYNQDGTDVSETVPQEIKDATCEYALQVLGDGSGVVALSTTPDQSDPRAITYNREKVGSLETEIHYDGTRGVQVQKTYPTADRIIVRSGYTRGGGGGGVIR